MRVPYKNPLTGPRNYIPNPDSAVVAPGYKGSPARGKSADRVVMTFEVQLMIRVILDVLLRSITLISTRSTENMEHAYL